MEKLEKVHLLLQKLINKKIIRSFSINDSRHNRTTIVINIIFEHESKILKKKFKLNYGFSWDLLNNKYFCGYRSGELFVTEEDFTYFMEHQAIPSRVKGFLNEERLYLVAKNTTKLTENIRVLKVFMGSEYADEKLKVDMWFQLAYNCYGIFDSLALSHTIMIGIQVKSSRELQLRHMNKFPYVPSLVVNTNMDNLCIENKLVQLLKNILRFKASQLYAMTLGEIEFDEQIVKFTHRGIKYNYNSLHK